MDKRWRKDHPDEVKAIRERQRPYRKEYYADPARQRRYKSQDLMRAFGIDIDTYESMLAAQGGVCAICKQPETFVATVNGRLGGKAPEGTRAKLLAVDHCHGTGKVRGLLCARCNHALGSFRDDVELLQRAIDYLEEFAGPRRLP